MAYTLKNKVRIVTAASLFDGHDVAINIMRSMKSKAKINALNNFLKIRINQLEAQLMTLNVNSSVDKQMNSHQNEFRYNWDQRNFQNC